jgi:alpha-beta hydrolase superfamily lysophospholipase
MPVPVPAYPATSEARHEEGFLHSKDNLRLFWQRYAPAAPRATVAVVHGGGDHSGRYPALTTALVRAGFQVDLCDLRGHGQSDGRRWHVDAFGDYLGDLDAFAAHVRAGAAGEKVLMVGHSMGGLLVASWVLAEERQVAGVVLSSPWLRMKRAPPWVKMVLGRLAGTVMPWLPIASGIALEELTADTELQRWTEADPLYGRATTPRWFVEAQRAQRELLRAAARLVRPVQVLVGMDDVIADPAAGRAFFEALGAADKQLRQYPGMRHELFNERERERPIADAVAWLAAHSR